MLSEAGKLSPVPFTRNYRKNPLTSLTVSLHIFEDVNANLLTHPYTLHVASLTAYYPLILAVKCLEKWIVLFIKLFIGFVKYVSAYIRAVLK